MKKTLYDHLIRISMVIFSALFFLSIGFLIYYTHAEPSIRSEEYNVEYIEDWTVVDEAGNSFDVKGPYNDKRLYEESFNTYATLPDDLGSGYVLCFFASNSYTVYVNGVERQKFVNPRDVLFPGGAVKSFYAQVPLSAEDSGAELRITRYPTPRRPVVVSETFVSNSLGIYRELELRFGFTFVLSTILLFVSAVIVLIGVIIRIVYKLHIELLYASLAVMILSAWMMTNSFLFPIAFGHYHIDGIVNYIMCMLIPFGFLVYLDSIQHKRYHKITAVLLVASAVNAILWTLLNFSGIFTFPRALLYIDIVLGMIIICVFGILFVDIKRGYSKEYRYTALGFEGFIVFAVIEIITLIFSLIVDDGIPMLLGLIWFLAFVVVQQITDFRKINEEKQNAIALSEAKTGFLASMSHEIRTPINSILGMNEMILRENKDETIEEYAKTISNSGKMLLSIVNDVLDFSKIESGKLEISYANYSFATLIRDINGIIEERTEGKGLNYDLKIEDDVPDGHYSDEFRIKQVLINLLTNAVKYTDSGTISLHVGGEYINISDPNGTFGLKITVSDTGRGIKDADKNGLFDAFSRADIKKNRNIEGTGLGLAIVKRILDNLGGTVSVESEYGKGSSFTVVIPVKVVDHTTVNARLKESMNRFEGSGALVKHYSDFIAPNAKILAVDDNVVNLNIVKLFLKSNHIVPDTCTGGLEAIEMCKKKKYDLLLLDHMMPSPDGIETIREIHESPDSLNSSTPAIVLTANALAGSRQIYMDAGFSDYITKPIDPARLEAAIKEYLPGKIIELSSDAESKNEEGESPLEAAFSKIKEVNYDTAVMHCSSDEILAEIISNIAAESEEMIRKMRQYAIEGDYEAYRRQAHTIKGHMAMIGASELSEHAKKHEFAGRDKDEEYIRKDSEIFFSEYQDLCRRLGSVKI